MHVHTQCERSLSRSLYIYVYIRRPLRGLEGVCCYFPPSVSSPWTPENRRSNPPPPGRLVPGPSSPLLRGHDKQLVSDPDFHYIFESILLRFSTLTGTPKSTKINKKCMPRNIFILRLFFAWFLVHLGFQLRSSELWKSALFLTKNEAFLKITCRSWHWFLLRFEDDIASIFAFKIK